MCCPVCHMTEVNKTLAWNFQGVKHYFCSTQCLQRFKAHPHLYVGDPQHGLAPKQKNQVVLKKRRIRLHETIDEDLKKTLEGGLKSLMGIKSVDFEQEDIFVIYDLLEISLDTIEEAIENCAVQLDGRILENIKRGLIHYSEECALDNLEHLTKDSHRH